MSMGAFDQQEYERREKKLSSIDTDSDDRRTRYEGRIEDAGDVSVDELLARFEERKEAKREKQ